MKKDQQVCRVGIDVGSTTIKMIVLDPSDTIIYKTYRRHKANINRIFAEELHTIIHTFPAFSYRIQITGSAGLGIAERTGIPFVQEVVSSVEVVNRLYPETRTLIDLGGEDAKMVFFHAGKQPDIRMNGNCAGGTGAFIDQMADLMHISIEELGQQAMQYDKIYPIASRCGVFAKTDVQNLICRNVPMNDLSASILHTVALQCITSLARGYDIESKVLCIGGPLTFLPALRHAFRELLQLKEEDFLMPENGEYFPALGCALLLKEEEENLQAVDIPALLQQLNATKTEEKDTLPPLFKGEEEYNQWKETRKIKRIKMEPLGLQQDISCFLGIDSGSTTTKIVVMKEDGHILYTYYSANEGNPLKKVVEGLQAFYRAAAEKGVNYRFLSSAVTGYGEDLVRSALNLDYGIVETMAHLSGAQYVDPEVSFILDIGGQDMKSLFVDQGVISNIELNEACSSGCGSFLQNFASTMHISLSDFSKAACLSACPSDLGSRCTVFMNSKVKQALREGAEIGDIAAGLAYSVVKNCLYKVLKINNLNQLGDHIVVQGGTFRNDAVYRVLEQLSGKTVSTTDHPELMGALGAALYAQRRWNEEKTTSFTGHEALPDVDHIETKELQCKGCTNKCSVLRFRFKNGNTSYAGNKCEKVFFNKNTVHQKGYNAFEKKNEILFQREEITAQNETLPVIGIPRVLNMFENYPFWHRLFTDCGLRVVLSPESTFALYQKGVGSVMSENICFPAKLVHGHIHALAEAGVDRIFYPIVPKEEAEFGKANNSYNCPVVSGYPDVIRSAMNPEERFGIPFDKPVVTFSSDQALEKACWIYISSLGVPKGIFRSAFTHALKERAATKEKLAVEQKRIFDEAVTNNKPVFVVAGRPYHADPLIHQKVGQILSDLGGYVFTDDVFRVTNQQGFGVLNIVSQWSYPNRTVQAAMEVAKSPRNVQYIQLNSFGCGPDSFFMDEIGDILKQAGKNHTILRIDEIASPGSIRLRLRSLIESLKAIQPTDMPSEAKGFEAYGVTYKKEDRKKTILIPWFADYISPFIPAIGKLAGYRIVNLPKSSKASAEIGLKYGHNEVCYPSTLIVGDIIMGLQSGQYDLENTVVAITQTGGQCRATNYISQIKNAIRSAGFKDIPILAVSTGKVYQNDQRAFKIPVVKLIHIIIYAILYADAIQSMYSSLVSREKKEGESKQLFDFYIEQGVKATQRNDHQCLVELLEQAIADFNQVAIYDRVFTKVGLIGEIYLKYNNYGQAHITEWLRSKGMEVHTPPIMDFVLPYFVNAQTNVKNGIKKETILGDLFNSIAWKYINKQMQVFESRMKNFRFYEPSESIFVKAEYASEVLDLAHQFGEGWSIPAEVACYARQGVNKVVCIQPFGCIANHIVARGVEKRLKKIYPEMNILFLDIDGGVAEVNLQNRLHFMMAYT
ncbi:putative CoA-substrate-specific enzyme activase [Parabacteroides sp. PFB2-12]|uniref:acyl-CoA dehydratase activase n=1 Tax=unclassified Parabacteroides TaxID=2649774 RepID=UPI002475920B|nr:MULTISPECIES: acyl-CoA dehydratase activase [unclassified Parabacteroides]MDH6343710.1 putative CoA-substrate-specific enzyme activase [Parabacteroides sp. PM6-13]MDH6391346.1 putative CoA-substrate-specific enzyme activase [Parabacteroides sp. PFB2-12]